MVFTSCFHAHEYNLKPAPDLSIVGVKAQKTDTPVSCTESVSTQAEDIFLTEIFALSGEKIVNPSLRGHLRD